MNKDNTNELDYKKITKAQTQKAFLRRVLDDEEILQQLENITQLAKQENSQEKISKAIKILSGLYDDLNNFFNQQYDSFILSEQVNEKEIIRVLDDATPQSKDLLKRIYLLERIIKFYDFLDIEELERKKDKTIKDMQLLSGIREANKLIKETQDIINELNENEKQEVLNNIKLNTPSYYSYVQNNSFTKELIRRNTESAEHESHIKIHNDNDVTISNGKITYFDKAIMDVLFKCYIEKRTIKNGKGYIKLTDINNDLTGEKKTKLKDTRKADIINSLDNLKFTMNYKTSDELANILGVSRRELDDDLKKFNTLSIQNEQFLNYSIINGEINKKPVQVVLFDFGYFAKTLISYLYDSGYYEKMSNEIKAIKYIDDKGNLINLVMTKDRIVLRECLEMFVLSYIRATYTKKPHSNKKPYEDIFKECEINATHTQTKQRTIDTIKTMLNHYKRYGIIADWKEYKNKSDGKKGVMIRLTDVN